MTNQFFVRPKSSEREHKNMRPIVKGKWIEFSTTEYATREKQTRVLIDMNEISNIKEHYEPEKWGNNGWCLVFLKNGQEYEVHSPYEELVKILTDTRSSKK